MLIQSRPSTLRLQTIFCLRRDNKKAIDQVLTCSLEDGVQELVENMKLDTLPLPKNAFSR